MRAGARTVELHERIECPILGIIALFMLVGLTKRPGLEVSSMPELGVIADLGSPLIKDVSRAAPAIPGKDTEHERRQRCSHIPMPRNRGHAATSLARTTTRR